MTWTVADPSRRVELQSDFASLPLCEQLVINDRLKKVKFVDDIHYPEFAISYGFGLTTLSNTLDGALLDRVFLHEMGHIWDWSIYPRPSEDSQFEWDVAADFAAMTPREASENDYIRTPKEAFAELFSAHFVPLTYRSTRGHFDLGLMRQSEGRFIEELRSKCPGEEEHAQSLETSVR